MNGADTAKRLGVTLAGLTVLTIAGGDSRGRATGPAFGVATYGPRLALRRGGMLRAMDFGPDVLTPAGRAVLAKARKIGW